jgi:hypothetical protein
MGFSEFFHDITAGISAFEPASTSFDKGGAVAQPQKFITQGTRAGGLTYADGDKLEKVDAVSSATYGDSVHFVPTGNLAVSNPGDARFEKDPSNSIDGVTKVEVGVSFDLYANAALLEAAGRGTAQTANVSAKAAGVTVVAAKLADGTFAGADGAPLASAPPIYKPKHMLADGNWGRRAETPVNASAVKPLPGTGAGTEAVTYGGNWGDKMTGVVFEGLEQEYGGAVTDPSLPSGAALYWDNFAEHIYAGYIEDSEGHREPLVFLQNIFTHRMHTDFDIAISPSRFSRLGSLKSPDTYKARVYVDGFEDVEVEFRMKAYANGGAALDAASYSTAEGGADKDLYISGVDGFGAYDPASLSISKGSSAVDAANYAASKTEDGRVRLTLKSGLFTGAFQGAYTVSLAPDSDDVASKALSLSLVKQVPRPLLTLNSDRVTGGVAAADQASPIAASKAGGKIYFTNDEFASALVASGRSGYSTIKEAGSGQAAAAAGAALARDGASGPYYIDLSAAAFEPGKTYEIAAAAAGFETQVYYVHVN